MTNGQPSSDGLTEQAPARARARKGDGHLLRERIVDAAVAELTDPERSEEITVRLIAARTGVSAPAIYLHFTTKEELLFEAAKRIESERRAKRINRSLNANPLVALVSRGMDLIDQVSREPEVYRLLMLTPTEQTPETFRHERSTAVEMFDNAVALLKRAADLGLIPTDSDPNVLASFVLIVSHGLLSSIANHSDIPGLVDLDTIRSEFAMLGTALGASEATIDEMRAAVDNHPFWKATARHRSGAVGLRGPVDAGSRSLDGGFAFGQ
jgi:AcrR family transcriptional regulator